MKICFSTLGCAERDLDGVIALAKEYNFDAIELRGLGGEMDNRNILELSVGAREETLKKLRESNIAPLVLGTSCSFHDETKYASFIEEGYAAIDIAQSFGFRGIRVFGNNVVGDETECVRRVGEGIRTLCEYAADKGVDVLLETHGDFNTRQRLGAVCDACREYENFGLIWDICHTRKTYGADWRNFVDEFGALIRHVHLKDVLADKLVLPGEGELAIADMVRYLEARGYGGYFSLEWEKKWHPELPPIEEGIEALLRVLA